MKQYLKSNAIKFDFAFHNKAMNSIYPIKEQLNVAMPTIMFLKVFIIN